MDNFHIFLKGFFAGLVMCAPMGPVGILCVRRTFMEGRLAGVFSVLGGSSVDGLYCAVAGLGAAYISTFLHEQRILLQVCAGLVLTLVGTRIFLAAPPEEEGAARLTGKGRWNAFRGTFLLTLVNPLPIIVFTALFTALEVHGWSRGPAETGALVLGVLCGSAFWAPILVTLVSIFRLRFTPAQTRWMNRVTGGLIFVCGLALALKALL